MSNKHNLVLYVDKDLVEKTRDLGFNLSKTFENYLKHLLNQFSSVNLVNNHESLNDKALWWAGPDLNRRPLARKAPELPLDNEDQLLERFRDFQIIDLKRSKRTAYEKIWFIKRLFKTVRTACLNCKKFVKCDNIGKFEECVDFEEVEGEACAK